MERFSHITSHKLNPENHQTKNRPFFKKSFESDCHAESIYDNGNKNFGNFLTKIKIFGKSSALDTEEQNMEPWDTEEPLDQY